MSKLKEIYRKDLIRYGDSIDGRTARLLKYLRKCQYSSNNCRY